MVQFIEISYKSFEYESMHAASRQILKFLPGDWKFSRYSFPVKIKKFTLLRSPHIDKKSREQFQIKYYKDKIILFPTRINNIEGETKNTDSRQKKEISLFLENIKHIPFSGVQVQIQMIYKGFLS